MSEQVSFKARARAVDHLGRGQIADAPTAVSELWKNAYDAYARNVGLHVFAGTPNVGAIFDDGIGMSHRDVIDRWLVIGTESKAGDDAGGSIDTLGLPVRERQGEKGIGRLSVAFLAPATVLVSKRRDGPFVAVMVDWRLFENPYLSLEEVRLPVAEFRTAADLARGLPRMVGDLTANLGSPDDASDRIAASWARYGAQEAAAGHRTTAAAISATWQTLAVTARHLEEWPVFLGLVEHGTAMFMVDLNHELSVWVDPEAVGDEPDQVRNRLRETLTGFTDPFADPRPLFDYEVWRHPAQGRPERVVAASDVFGIEDLHALEHYVDGAFEADGTFVGKVVAFGQDLGTRTYRPRQTLPGNARDRVGPFRLSIGTFEQDPRRTTHSEERHGALGQQAERFGGVRVYRDDLRVMPYGRPDADFFGIEERRGKHAGRYFWAHRRSFGRISFRRGDNPNLRDKAGREGLVDNRARRQLRFLVADLLVDFASTYFGSDSDLRKAQMPEIMARNAAAKAAADKARSTRRKGVRQFLREQTKVLDDALMRSESLVELGRSALRSRDAIEAAVLNARHRELLDGRDALRPPAVAANLGDLEDSYRSYRNGYARLVEQVDEVGKLVAEVGSVTADVPPEGVVRKAFEGHEATLNVRLDGYARSVDEKLGDLHARWAGLVGEDRRAYRERFGHHLTEAVPQRMLLPMLNLLDAGRAELEEAFAGRYPPFLRTLDTLAAGIDLEGAFGSTEDERSELEERLRNLQAVAQVGVTVEIIGHELETLEGEVRRNLNALPAAARQTPAFQAALNAHHALADRLRFLSPMKVAGYRARERITGAQVADYVAEFFGRVFRDRRIDFEATAAFRGLAITDIPARIYPVFLNLVNNAVYWVSQATDRRIRLDLVEGRVVVADSGPGVDPDDVGRLFDLFFTRRHAGRGVGLYLSRANLSVGYHRIRYAGPDDPKVLGGANFIIEFRGMTTDG